MNLLLAQMAGGMLAGIHSVRQGFEFTGLLFLRGGMNVPASSRVKPAPTGKALPLGLLSTLWER
ncbi:MAG: hypothetical protein WBQ92_18350, partial [Pseudomonas alloputida]